MLPGFAFVGSILQLGAIILGLILGYISTPAIVGITCTALVFQTGYTLIRFPQILSIWKRDGTGGVFKLLVLLFCINLAIGGFFYGAGRGIGYLIR